MKTAASIFSWLGGIVTTIIAIVTISKGIDVPVQKCTYSYYYGTSCNTVIEHQSAPSWLWVLLVVGIIIRLIVLIWRQYATSNGSKVGCGVCTLIFASVIGGILTLCIPEEDLYDRPAVIHTSNARISSQAVTGLNRASKVRELDQKLLRNEITKEQYDKQIAILDGKPTTQAKPKTLSEEEKIETIKKYKQLLDDGAIAEEEFEKKKEDILK